MNRHTNYLITIKILLNTLPENTIFYNSFVTLTHFVAISCVYVSHFQIRVALKLFKVCPRMSAVNLELSIVINNVKPLKSFK